MMLYNTDALSGLQSLADASVHMIVTSPPYYGLRRYLKVNHPLAQFELGTESTLTEYVIRLGEILREAHRVLRDDGTMWLNLGDTYGHGTRTVRQISKTSTLGVKTHLAQSIHRHGETAKNLLMIPARVALALQGVATLSLQELRGLCMAIDCQDMPALEAFRAGFALWEILQDTKWILRSDIIWEKANPLPSPVRDRPSPAHEYIFLLSKTDQYYYDYEAIKEPAVSAGLVRTIGSKKGVATKIDETSPEYRNGSEWYGRNVATGASRNRRSVWRVANNPLSVDHAAAFPSSLIEPMILAGCPHQVDALTGHPFTRLVKRREIEAEHYKGEEALKRQGKLSADIELYETIGWDEPKNFSGQVAAGVVLDPFMGSGTTALVAVQHKRRWIGFEINEAYCKLIHQRLELGFNSDDKKRLHESRMEGVF